MISRYCAAAIAAMAFGAASAQAAAIDATVYTTFQVAPGGTSISWVTCGATAGSSGCYSSGSIGPFSRACAVMQGPAKTKAGVVTRQIFVLDGRQGKTSPVLLQVFTKTDTLSASSDSVSIVPAATLTLPMTGGNGAKCFMAGNASGVFAGTSITTSAAQIALPGLTLGSVPGFSPPETLTGISADERGYVSVQYNGGFYLYGPGGGVVEDGGGAATMLNSANAVLLNK